MDQSDVPSLPKSYLNTRRKFVCCYITCTIFFFQILAKLVAGMHKPKCQTVIPHENVPELYETLPIRKVRSLGGKFGKTVAQKLSISSMSQLYNFSKEELIEKFNVKNG